MKQKINTGQIYCTRIWEVDFLRGLCVFLMIFDHLMFDLAYVFRSIWFSADGHGILLSLCSFARYNYYPWEPREIVRYAVVLSFILLCGISCSFSRSNLKRGLKLAAVAVLLTLVTWSIDLILGKADHFIILFGILHMLAVAILLYWLLSRYDKKWLLVSGILIIVIGSIISLYPPPVNNNLLAILGLHNQSFYSADYFPLLPWVGYFLIGTVLGPWIYHQKRSLFGRTSAYIAERPVLFAGRHALILYVLHQPAVYLILLLIGYIFIY